jgi:hypothetical protein
MEMVRSSLFNTVAKADHLGFFANQALQAERVAEFLEFKKADVAHVAGVARASVRWDHKIPVEVQHRMTEIANICALVAQFFEGDAVKTALWFKTKNPMLGGISPRDMIRFGRYEKLQDFVFDALDDNHAAEPPVNEAPAGGATSSAAA